MSCIRARLLGAVLTAAMVGASFGAAVADDAHAKRGPVSAKAKADKRGNAGDARRAAKAAGRKVG